MSYVYTQKQIENDSNRVMLIFACSAIAISAAWFVWAFYSKISIFETTEKAQIVSDGIIAAEFPLSSNVLIQLNQMAIFELKNLPWPSFPKFQGKTIKVYPHPSKESLIVQVKIEGENISISPMTSGMVGKLVIRIGEISPLNLMIKNISDIIATKETTTEKI